MFGARGHRRFPGPRAEAAQVGIGTMIVFIATILASSLAAAVLLEASGKLQAQGGQTGRAAIDRVTSNLQLESLVGRRDASTDAGLKDLDLYLGLAPGSRPVDLSQIRFQLQNGTQLKTFNYTTQATPAANQYSGSAIRDADGSFSAARPTLTAGDYVNASVALDTSGLELRPRDHVSLVVMPEVGTQVVYGFDTPSTYDTRTVIELR